MSEANHTCRICFEPCEEKTTCKCVGYVHNDCQEKWINISGRRNCEVCLEPFQTTVVYEWKWTTGNQRCTLGSPSDAIVLLILMIALNGVYATLLLVIPEWVYIVWGAFAMTLFVVMMFNFEPAHTEDIALIWKWSSFITLVLTYSVRIGMRPFLTTEDIEQRVHMIHIDMVLLCGMFVVRMFCNALRGMRVRRITTSHGTSDTSSES